MSDPKKQQRFERRKIRIRKKVNGTGERPRLNVFRSNAYIYAQIIDDFQQKTLVAASSKDSTVKGKASNGGKTDMVTVKNLDDEVVDLDDVRDGRKTVIAFLRHFG